MKADLVSAAAPTTPLMRNVSSNKEMT